MSQFSIFYPTKATIKLANGNTENAQGTGINLCNFYYCSTVYPVGPVYYFPVHPYNTISSGALRFYVGSQNVTSTPLEIFDFVDPQGHSWRSTYQTQNNIDYIQIKKFQGQNSNKQEYCCTNCICPINNLSQIIHQRFDHVSIDRLKGTTKKGPMEGLPKNILDLEEP